MILIMTHCVVIQPVVLMMEELQTVEQLMEERPMVVMMVEVQMKVVNIME